MKHRKPTKEILLNGRKMTIYSIGWLSILTNKCLANIRRWERMGILPKPIVKLPSENRRYYLAAELIGYTKVYQQANVRTGFALTSTNFKQKAREFRNQLQVALNDPKKFNQLEEKLPNEKAFSKQVSQKLEQKIREKAHSIIADISRTQHNQDNENTNSKTGRRRSPTKDHGDSSDRNNRDSERHPPSGSKTKHRVSKC